VGPGVYPAAVTPLNERGELDLPGVARLLAWFASNGCRGAVIAGTNGEGPSLSAPEKRDLIRTAVSAGRPIGLEIVLGVATGSLDEAIWLCRQAGDAGAEAALVMPPGYFREATDGGIRDWFLRVLDASPVPVLAYNFPKRAGVALSPELLGSLSSHERFLGAKDSSGEVVNLVACRQAVTDKLLYVGDETLLFQALEAGWTGTISGAANVLPRWLADIVAKYPDDPEGAAAKFDFVLPAIRALRSVPQPATNKAVLQKWGVLSSSMVKLPLLPRGVTEELWKALP
jgi:4-hydroxy-tetrahydrodipicolinate synthase